MKLNGIIFFVVLLSSLQSFAEGRSYFPYEHGKKMVEMAAGYPGYAHDLFAEGGTVDYFSEVGEKYRGLGLGVVRRGGYSNVSSESLETWFGDAGVRQNYLWVYAYLDNDPGNFSGIPMGKIEFNEMTFENIRGLRDRVGRNRFEANYVYIFPENGYVLVRDSRDVIVFPLSSIDQCIESEEESCQLEDAYLYVFQPSNTPHHNVDQWGNPRLSESGAPVQQDSVTRGMKIPYEVYYFKNRVEQY